MTSSYSGQPCFRCGKVPVGEFPWLVHTTEPPEFGKVAPICDECFYKYYEQPRIEKSGKKSK